MPHTTLPGHVCNFSDIPKRAPACPRDAAPQQAQAHLLQHRIQLQLCRAQGYSEFTGGS